MQVQCSCCGSDWESAPASAMCKCQMPDWDEVCAYSTMRVVKLRDRRLGLLNACRSGAALATGSARAGPMQPPPAPFPVQFSSC